MIAAYWDITSRCNLRCEYCCVAEFYRPGDGPADETVRTLSVVSVEESTAGRGAVTCVTPAVGPDAVASHEPAAPDPEAVIQNLVRCGVGQLHLLGGEPLLHPQWHTIVRLARENGIRTVVGTNGTTWTDAQLERVRACPPAQIHFSIDGCAAPQNDYLRGRGVFERAHGALERVLALRREMSDPPGISVQCALHRANHEAISEIAAHYAGLGIDGLTFERMTLYPGHSRKAAEAALSPQELLRAAVTAAQVSTQLRGRLPVSLGWGRMKLRIFLEENFGLPAPSSVLCGAVHGHLYIQADGSAHPCQNVVHCLGSDQDEQKAGPGGRAAPLDLDSLDNRRLFDPGGQPAFLPEAIRLDRPGARVFDSAYFADFFRFAHSGWVYEPLSACRSCAYHDRCEPCPLDAVTLGDRVNEECRLVDALGAERTRPQVAGAAACRPEPSAGGIGTADCSSAGTDETRPGSRNRLIARPSNAYSYLDRRQMLVLFNRTANTWFRVDSRLGPALWDKTSAPISRKDLVNQVVVEFPDHPEEDLRRDLEVFLDQLIHQGFLTVVAAGTTR